MTQQTKNLENRLIQSIEKRTVVDEKLESLIRSTIRIAFQEGWSEGVDDVRSGLIK